MLATPPEHDACLSQERHSLLDDAIQRLPERYRTAVVLCYVQGKKMREAAAELRCPTATISTRLRRARALLERNLRRRGVAFESSGLFAAESIRSAVQGQLVNDTLRLAFPPVDPSLVGPVPEVIALANEVSRVMAFTKIKIAGALVAGLLLFMAIGGATAIRLAHAAEQQPPASMATAQAARQKQPAQQPAASEEPRHIVITGRVLGPDGKPMAGAALYSPRFRKKPTNGAEEVAMVLRGKTAADGSFRLEFSNSAGPSGVAIPLVAAVPGYGCDWRVLGKESSYRFDLRLTRDQPIRGRILDMEGKPLGGVRLEAVELLASRDETLEDFLRFWKARWLQGTQQLPKAATLRSPVLQATQTDSSGRFEVRGLGVERVAKITIEGAGIAKRLVYVVTRPGFDPAPYNRAANMPLFEGGLPLAPTLYGPPILYGPTFDYVADRGRVIEGTVRDASTGQPLAGVSISGNLADGEAAVSTTSDADGQYRLIGPGKAFQYTLGAVAMSKGPWLATYKDVAGSRGFEPIHLDFSMPRGVMVRGRVVDRATGKGVEAEIRIVPLVGNRFFGDHRFFGSNLVFEVWRRSRVRSSTDAKGNFQIATIPGPSVILVNVGSSGNMLNGLPVRRYAVARVDSSDRQRLGIPPTGSTVCVQTAGGGVEFLSEINGYKLVDIPEKGQAADCTVYVDAGRAVSVEIEDPDGKPLPGTFVSGLTALWPIAFPLTEPRCTVYGLDGTTPRPVLFYHKGRKLAGALRVSGKDPEPLHIRLAPTVAMRGRLLDAGGKPLAGITVELWMTEVTQGLLCLIGEPTKMVVTDQNGRFVLDGLVPNGDVGVMLSRGKKPVEIQTRIGIRRVPPGTTLDLGDIRSK